jgi:hypothetical protein
VSLRSHLASDEGIAELRERWSANPRGMRIDDVLDADAASALLNALRQQPHNLLATSSVNISFQYLASTLVPEDDCDHQLCVFGRWLFGDACAWLSKITGLELGPAPDRQMIATLYTKGSYLALHNDYDGKRKVAFIYGLTPPESELLEPDGHLDMLTDDEAGVTVVDRRPPGWNTLDIFQVTGKTQWHRVNMVRTHAERRAIAGWCY